MLWEVRQSWENSDNQVSTSSRYGVLSSRCDEAQLNFLLKRSYWTAVKIFKAKGFCKSLGERKRWWTQGRWKIKNGEQTRRMKNDSGSRSWLASKLLSRLTVCCRKSRLNDAVRLMNSHMRLFLLRHTWTSKVRNKNLSTRIYCS